jgi:hypothetical protein
MKASKIELIFIGGKMALCQDVIYEIISWVDGRTLLALLEANRAMRGDIRAWLGRVGPLEALIELECDVSAYLLMYQALVVRDEANMRPLLRVLEDKMGLVPLFRPKKGQLKVKMAEVMISCGICPFPQPLTSNYGDLVNIFTVLLQLMNRWPYRVMVDYAHKLLSWIYNHNNHSIRTERLRFIILLKALLVCRVPVFNVVAPIIGNHLHCGYIDNVVLKLKTKRDFIRFVKYNWNIDWLIGREWGYSLDDMIAEVIREIRRAY